MAAIRLLWRSSAQRAVGSARTDLLSCSSMGLPGHLLQVRASCYGELNDEGCNLTLPALAGGLDVSASTTLLSLSAIEWYTSLAACRGQ